MPNIIDNMVNLRSYTKYYYYMYIYIYIYIERERERETVQTAVPHEVGDLNMV